MSYGEFGRNSNCWELLFGELRKAAVSGPSLEVWLCIFGSPLVDEYEAGIGPALCMGIAR